MGLVFLKFANTSNFCKDICTIMSHHCKALMLHCIDFRFGKAIEDYLERNGLLNNCDIVSVAGAVKNLVAPKETSDRSFIIRQIEISKKLHDIENVILMNHTDCGAYGETSVFTNDAEEIKKHSDDLKEAKNIVQEQYPDLGIQLVLSKINSSGQITFEEIK